MNLELYCSYANYYNIKCDLTDIVIECNKHYIIKNIENQLPNYKCITFYENDIERNIRIDLINKNTNKKECYLLVSIYKLYDFTLIETFKNIRFICYNTY